MTETYEAIQAGAKGPGTDEWKAVDKERAALAALYRSLAEDDTRTDGYKTEKAREAYEKTRSRIEELAPAARRKMLRTAEIRERMSIPTPEGEGLLTEDTEKLLLASHERSRIEGLMSRSEKATGEGPFGGRKPAEILRGEYERGLEEGGPGGGATVLACISLVRDLGLDVHQVVDGRRRDFHRSCVEDAHNARMQADMVSKSVPAPPFRSGGGASGRAGTYRGKPAVLDSASGSAGSNPFKKKRRPAWR